MRPQPPLPPKPVAPAPKPEKHIVAFALTQDKDGYSVDALTLSPDGSTVLARRRLHGSDLLPITLDHMERHALQTILGGRT